jgi:glycosyltransferase involved in cell wall biosynthesis
MFKKKYTHACKYADKLVAISEQSKQDLMHYFNVPEEKVSVIYQGCNPIYYDTIEELEKEIIRKKYNLPQSYLLYVGTIEQRKNVLGIIEALHKGRIDMPLIIVGRARDYAKVVKQYVEENNLSNQVLFLHNVPNEDLPAMYQMAEVFVYPSMFEGFGIPILEALNSGTPVITTKGSCFPEVGGDAAQYVEFGNQDEMIATLNKVLDSKQLRKEMSEKGYQQALKFREKKFVNEWMEVYNSIV